MTPEQGARLQSFDGIVLVHGQQTVNNDQGRPRQLHFVSQAFDLPVELVQRKSSAQVKPSEARFRVGLQTSKRGQKS